MASLASDKPAVNYNLYTNICIASLTMAVLVSICALIFTSQILQQGDCSTVQVFFQKKPGEYLANHVIETKQAETELECSSHCVDHGSCVSVNYKTSGIGKGRCELNSKTLQDDDGNILNTDVDFLYIIEKIFEERVPDSCTSLRTENRSAESGMYSIKPQGFNFTVRVFCNMTSKNGVGVTEIGHDSESKTLVKGFEAPGSYKKTIKYNISMEQIVAIINQSKRCEQFIKFDCYAVRFFDEPSAWWVSRQGSNMTYWGGAAVDSGKCACGMTDSCAGGKKCNCDMNDKKWREDSGYLTDKNTLPVTELRFGDTKTPDYEKGYHTLGKLRCWG
ncbi:contactin-associated protein like 5-3-like [Dendronephthya gigantea]|uniref:contactin-associated protein like 5-3-like n=1 Tax=Dendronephthya gigantea TaxID=151771 RepID=UPI00106A8EC3|nr:contactin-associated protein like 5-3-like [Dendronephthya gigantea]